jgi:ABC-type glycerol-3-phosphate transport system substrate-binding protein
MRAITRRFNLFLALMTLAALCGCQTNTKNKQVSALRMHIEASSVNNDTTQSNTAQSVTLLRSNPVLITVNKDPFLTEANIVAAAVIDAHGGFAIQVKFDEMGALTLEQIFASNPGKLYAVFGQWGEKPADGRWLAAPLITHRVADGILAFTADMSRAEADRLVTGLNNVSKTIRKGQIK